MFQRICILGHLLICIPSLRAMEIVQDLHFPLQQFFCRPPPSPTHSCCFAQAGCDQGALHTRLVKMIFLLYTLLPAYPVGSGRRFRACTGQQTRACLRRSRPFAAPQRNSDLIKLGTRVPFTGFFSPAISSMKGEQEVSWTHMAWSPFCSWQ